MSRATQQARINDRAAAAARRQRHFRAGTALAVVLLVISAMVIARASTSRHTSQATTVTASATVVSGLAGVSPAVISAVGSESGNPPTPLTSAPALTADGLPRVVYVGAEFCPYCAAQRWAVVQALSRFGTFSGLGMTSSSSTDIYPSTATLSFHGATYASKYLSFSGFETSTTDHKPLDTLPNDVEKLVDAYNSSGSIPFIDLGGKATVSGASFSPTVLKGKTQAQIVAALSDPSDPITQAIIGNANELTKTLCGLTGQQPSNVCTS